MQVQVFLTQITFLVSTLMKEIFTMMTFTLNRKETRKVKETLQMILKETETTKKLMYKLNLDY